MGNYRENLFCILYIPTVYRSLVSVHLYSSTLYKCTVHRGATGFEVGGHGRAAALSGGGGVTRHSKGVA